MPEMRRIGNTCAQLFGMREVDVVEDLRIDRTSHRAGNKVADMLVSERGTERAMTILQA